MNLSDFISLLKSDLDKFHTFYVEQMAINEYPATMSEQEWAMALCEWEEKKGRK